MHFFHSHIARDSGFLFIFILPYMETVPTFRVKAFLSRFLD